MLTHVKCWFKIVINLTSLRENRSAISVRKISSFFLFSMQKFCKQGLQRTNFQLWKSSSDLKVLNQTVSYDYYQISFGVSFELEANYHVQLKIYLCFHGPFLKRIDMICKLWFALFIGFFLVISVNAWQGLKSWYTITMAFGLASQAQAKNYDFVFPCVILWAQPCFLLERVRKLTGAVTLTRSKFVRSLQCAVVGSENRPSLRGIFVTWP